MSNKSISRSQTKNELLYKSNKLFAKHGYYGTSIQMIGDALSIKKSSVLFHYKTKEELACKSVKQLTKFVSETIAKQAMLQKVLLNTRQTKFAEDMKSIIEEHNELLAPIYLIPVDSKSLRSSIKTYFDNWLILLKDIICCDRDAAVYRALSMTIGSMILYDLYEDEKILNILSESLKPGVL